ncbi:MAG: hypothetical protein AAFX80_22855 [Cyanobacteria bacterium J06639_18]
MKSGIRSQESEVRSQESEVRSQESGIRSQESGAVPGYFSLCSSKYLIPNLQSPIPISCT